MNNHPGALLNLLKSYSTVMDEYLFSFWGYIPFIHSDRMDVSFVLFSMFVKYLVPLLLLYFLYSYLKKSTSRKKWLLLAGLLGILAGTIYWSALSRAYHARPLVYDGKSTELSRTQIVSTLDTPIQSGKNIIWCASFQAAWKTLQNNVTKGPVQLEGTDETSGRLNNSFVPAVPQNALYAVAGQGIGEKIRQEMATRFPEIHPPDFSAILPNAIVAYGYLETRCSFPLPYFDNDKPLTFTDSMGNKTPIRTFGIRGKDESKYLSLRNQVKVLVAARSLEDRPEDFVIDLWRDSPETEVVFARVPAGNTLKSMLERIHEDIIMASHAKDYDDAFGVNGILLVPELAYRISHEFAELLNRSCQNPQLRGFAIVKAQQDILFRLDRSGSELFAESSILLASANAPVLGDKPFLVYLKKRGAEWPYYVMWVDNNELLMKW